MVIGNPLLKILATPLTSFCHHATISFAASLMEMYKQENEKGTGKSKSLKDNII